MGARGDSIIEHLKKSIEFDTRIAPQSPVVKAPAVDISNIQLSSPPDYKLGDKVATRNAYGTAIAKLGNTNDRVISLDGDTKNSTFAQTFKV